MIESAEEFVRLRESEDPDEYQRAAHEPASEAVWFEVVERYPEMRKWVAHNKTVPLSVLAVLASDPDSDVRDMVAMKRKVGPELLSRLAGDSHEGVRQSVATNAKTPREILERLANDPDEDIREAAQGQLERLASG